MTGTLENKVILLSCTRHSAVMFLDVPYLLNGVRQFLSWNINMHWQRLVSCGYRTYPTELLMAEMIDILSLNNGVAIPCSLQSATGAISEMLRSIKLSVCTISWGRISSCKNWMLQGGLRMHAFIHIWIKNLCTSGVYISHINSGKNSPLYCIAETFANADGFQ